MDLTTDSSEKCKAHSEPAVEIFILTQCNHYVMMTSHAP